MNSKERFNAIMHFQEFDYMFNMEFGCWNDTMDVWHSQGLPYDIREEILSGIIFSYYFGLEQTMGMGPNVGLHPGFKKKVLEETERYKIIQDEEGVQYMANKVEMATIPHYLEFPVKDRHSWDEFKKRLDPRTPGRYPDDWDKMVVAINNSTYPVGLSVGSLFGWIRNWMGFEVSTTLFYDDPGLVADMMDTIVHNVIETITPALKQVKRFDCASFWEDMAFKTGTMVSPRLFEEYMVPRYKKITDLLNKYGIDVVIVDCDGNIDELVPLWLEAGVNCMTPLEINSGSDPWKYRNKYGNRVLMTGGIDKKALIKGKDAIKEELNRIKGLVPMGGYIPHLDHMVPPDVTLENYRYYLEAKKDILGIR